MNDLKEVKEKYMCGMCNVYSPLDIDQVPSLLSSNGFAYPPYPMHSPSLDSISERLVAPRLPFMQIRRLRHKIG
jgi:hypothetical protein